MRTLGCFVALCGLAVSSGQAQAPAENAGPSVAVVVGEKAADLERMAGEELCGYIGKLYGVQVAPTAEIPASAEVVVLVGSPETNPALAKAAQQAPLRQLTDQGLLLRPVDVEGKRGLIVTGGSPRAVLWAAYELVERWGVRYLVHGDVLPAKAGALQLPDSEVVVEPNMRTRCWRLVNDLADGPVSWSLEENKRFLRQIAKMKYNRIHLSFWPCQPFVDYTFHGVRKPGGMLYFGEHFPIDNDTVGREKFGGMTEFTNPELAGVAGDELLERGLALAHGILAEAKTLGMETGISIQVFEWPKEFMAALAGSEPATQLGGLTAGPGQNQAMDDPLLREMVGTIFRAYVETYPEAEYVHVGMPEHRGWTGQAQEAFDALTAQYGDSGLGTFDELCARARGRTSFPGGGERVERMVKGDLAGLLFFDSLVREKKLLERGAGAPRVKLVYANVTEELFPLLGKMMPAGGEILSFIDYTASRVLRQVELLRRRPPANTPANFIFTLADDNVGVLPQLATGSLHQVLAELRANGWSGFYTRYWTVGDLNPTVHYLARASWDANVTPEAAYRDLVEHACGIESVEPALAAFWTVEEITKGLDQYGLGFGFPVPEMMTKHYGAGGLSAELKGDHARYREALANLRVARERSAPSGQPFLDYLVGRLTFAARYLDAAESFGATAVAEKAGNRAEAARTIEDAYQAIREALGAWATVAEDHGDLGAVALMNAYCYRPIRDKRNALAGGAEIIERVPVGEIGDYKPCVAKLPNGELLISAFHQNQLAEGKIREDILLFRSKDGGHTWPERRVLDMLVGREPYLTVLKNGTALMTVHFLTQDVRNTVGYVHSYIHRSEDAGQTWTTTRVQPDGAPAGVEIVTSRNVLELSDGSLLVGVSGNRRGCDFMWRSTDGGRTWSEKYPAQVEGVRDDYPYQLFGEAKLWEAAPASAQAGSGKLYAIVRVDSRFFAPLANRDVKLGESDQFDRMILYASGDTGRTWRPAGDFGDYGEMYPAVLALNDGRLLLTFTVREVKRPLGVQAVLGATNADGFGFNFEWPRFLLDTKTPNDKDSGGGFGGTVQLEDGTLVTSYSYRGEDNQTHCEVVRWRVGHP